MFISDLKLHGFKSFANKANMDFGEGITAVVGPNGCGKTNIVDAIRWVLGEQKYSILRSGRMEDIIFNGAKGLKPLSVCEVSLTVHNNKGKLPIEYNDVEIGRRIYRNGDSEYTLNRTPCRLKDIQDLFVDTGMGADAYSVIELKMIEQILSETGEDRKRMFEEAAGINKYKTQRKSAIRKFEATRQDLDRINDIILEVKTKVHGLNLQLKRFKRHENMTKYLKESEISLAFLKIVRYEELARPLYKKIEEFKRIRKSKETKESIHEAKLVRLREVYQQQDRELISLQDELKTLEEERDEYHQNVLVYTEQKRSAESTLERLHLEKKSNDTKRDKLSTQINGIEQEVESLNPHVEAKLVEYKGKKQTFDSVEREYEKAQAFVEKLQSKRWEEQRKVSDQESLFKRTESLIEEKTKLVQKLEKNLESMEKNQVEYSSQQKTIEQKKTNIQNKLDKKNTKLTERKSILLTLKEDRQESTQKRHYVLTQSESLESQLQFYRELVAKGEGLPGGSRYILDRKEDYPEIFGTIADLFQVDEKYQSAIDSALGDLAFCLVAKDRKTALSVLETVRGKEVGNMSIIPLKELSASVPGLKPLPKNKEVIGRGSDLVKTKRSFQALAEFLLGDLLLVNDLKEAIKGSNLAGWNTVDLSGDYFGKNMILWTPDKSGKVIVGRREKIEHLQREIDGLGEKAESLKNKILFNENDITKKEEELEGLSIEISTLLEERSAVEAKIIQNHYQQAQIMGSIQEEKLELKEAQESLTQLSYSLIDFAPKIKDAHTMLDNLQGSLEKSGENLAKARSERDTFYQQVQDIRIELLNLENQRENLQIQKKTAEGTISELKNRRQGIESETQFSEEKKETLKTQIEEGERKLVKINGRLHHHRSILELKRQVYSETYQEIEATENQIRSEQRNRESILEELKKCELEIVEDEQQIQLIRERIRDHYDEEISKTLQVEKDEAILISDIERTKQSIERIGPVNMAVQLEYDDENNRFGLLNEQRDDLISAEENLRNTIQKIDKVARIQFQNTFDQIKLNFEKLFVLFFEGGQASLELTGDPDPLEADISIRAQPPGKRNQHLRMLSAGEKSLTAIALLFSIYQYKPSPYCILDEVDAPLDDMNIKKFTRVLKKFSVETQFIIVTHNKLTMEAANYLYGVTMENKGVSKLVSVRFES